MTQVIVNAYRWEKWNKHIKVNVIVVIIPHPVLIRHYTTCRYEMIIIIINKLMRNDKIGNELVWMIRSIINIKTGIDLGLIEPEISPEIECKKRRWILTSLRSKWTILHALAPSRQLRMHSPNDQCMFGMSVRFRSLGKSGMKTIIEAIWRIPTNIQWTDMFIQRKTYLFVNEKVTIACTQYFMYTHNRVLVQNYSYEREKF